MKYSGYFGRVMVCLIGGLLLLLMACTPKATPGPVLTPAPLIASDSPAWELEWEKILSMARKEKRATIYVAYGMAPSRDVMIDALRQKYGIDLEVLALTGSQLSAKLLTERKAGIYAVDVYLGGIGTLIRDLIPAGVMDPIEPLLLLPEIKDQNVWLGGWPIMDKGRHIFSSTAEVSTRIGFNTELVKPTEIRSLKDLLDPKWKGKIVMDDPRGGGGSVGVLHLAKTLYGEDFVWQFLLKQDAFVSRDARQIVEWVARGKYLIAVGASASNLKTLASAGAPIAMVSKLENEMELFSGSGSLAAVNKPPNTYGQKVLINWILSREGQTIISKSQGVASRRLDVSTSHLEPQQVPDLKEKYIVETEDYSMGRTATSELAKRIMAEVGYQ